MHHYSPWRESEKYIRVWFLEREEFKFKISTYFPIFLFSNK